MTDRPLGAQISHMLKARGVDVIFGIPGVHNIEMYRGIEEVGITHILARHEQGAGFMADGYARASGKPGVAYVITGPGLTNILTAAGQAYSDSVPLLVISSCLDETAARRGQLHQMIDQERAAACVFDWSHEVKSAEAVYTLVERALNEFAGERPRPKHIQVPIALGGTLASTAPTPPVARPKRCVATTDQITDAADRFKVSRRPVIILGGGAVPAAGSITSILASTGAAVFTTYSGRGLVADDYPLNLGAYLGRPDSADLLAQADLLLVIGTELAEVDLWRTELGHTAPVIRVDIDPVELDHPQSDLAILSDSAAFLTALASALPDEGQSDWEPATLAELRARWRLETDAERPGIVPVADALRTALPEDTMIYSDMTQFAYAAKEIWPMARPGHWHHPMGFGTLGYALPAAVGGAIARAGAPTLAIMGDSGFQYTMQELGTAVELGLPLPIFLWDNGKLGEIEASMIRAQIAPNAVIARNPDFCALAEAYGAYSARPDTLEEMQKSVRAALDADRPTLIHVRAGIADGL
ncbi:MAG: 5-guanidino-2-oxopentanoate decarboxylase [Pseudomonadota bacterium]